MKFKFIIIAIVLVVLLCYAWMAIDMVTGLADDVKDTIYEWTDPNCLKQKAKDFCSDTYEKAEVYADDTFRCVIKDLPRTDTMELSEKYHFLKEELKDCIRTNNQLNLSESGRN